MKSEYLLALKQPGSRKGLAMFGYFGAVSVAVTVALFATQAWIKGTPFFFSRFELWFWLAILLFNIFLNWATGILPFLVVRKLAGKGGLQNIWLCLAAGVAMVSLTLPIDLWIGRGLDFEGPSRPYLQQLATLIAGFWPILLISGAAGGIAYRWIERIERSSSALGRLGEASTDISRPGEVTSFQTGVLAVADWIRRRPLKVLGVAVAIALCPFVLPRWWEPHVSWWSLIHSSAGMPKVELVHEIMASYPSAITWLPDGSLLASISGSSRNGLLVIWNDKGQIVQQLALPHSVSTPSLVFIADGRQVVVAGGSAQDIAFSVLDIATALPVHEERGPEPGGAANKNRATAIAVSPDRSLLAVAFGRAPRPAALYATKDWKQLRVLDGIPFSAWDTPRDLTFDGNGRRLAFAKGRDIAVLDTETGALVQHVAAQNAVHHLAFSADGNTVAAIIRDSIGVFRVAGGKEVASYPHGGSGLSWDPRGQFIAFDDAYNVLHLWNPFGPPENELTIQLRPGAIQLAFSPDAGRMAVANGNYVSVFEIMPRSARP